MRSDPTRRVQTRRVTLAGGRPPGATLRTGGAARLSGRLAGGATETSDPSESLFPGRRPRLRPVPKTHLHKGYLTFRLGGRAKVLLQSTLRQAWSRELPETAKCVQVVDVQCVLQFTSLLAAGCALHRRTSRVIHRSELFRGFLCFVCYRLH